MRGLLLLALLLAPLAGAEPLAVCASTEDLASLARAVGGGRLEVQAFARGHDDPHLVDVRPGFVRALARADALIENGMELEAAWLPAAVEQARNPKLRPGAPGRIVAGEAIAPLGVPPDGADRAAGDLHAGGNPHFLLDPCSGLAGARVLRHRLAAL